MKRLTDNNVAFCIENDCYIEMSKDEVRETTSNTPTMEDLYIKLNKYEKLEQELGCPLDIYVKLHKIVYVYTKVGKCKLLKIQDGFIVVKIDNKTTYLPLREYTETWWLKENKEE